MKAVGEIFEEVEVWIVLGVIGNIAFRLEIPPDDGPIVEEARAHVVRQLALQPRCQHPLSSEESDGIREGVVAHFGEALEEGDAKTRAKSLQRLRQVSFPVRAGDAVQDEQQDTW